MASVPLRYAFYGSFRVEARLRFALDISACVFVFVFVVEDVINLKCIKIFKVQTATSEGFIKHSFSRFTLKLPPAYTQWLKEFKNG